LAEEWVNIYEATCPGTTLVYNAIGSSTGIRLFVAGQEDFAASDFMLTPADLQNAQTKGGPVVQIPWAAGAIALEYKLRGVLQLNLSATDIAGIFSGHIKRWDDPRLQHDNPGVRLPSEPIQVVYRSDGSGTTDVLTSYLVDAAPSVWKYGANANWPGPVGQGARGSDGVTDIVRSTEGAIGYAQLSYAEANDLGVANVLNPAGHFVTPDASSVSAALRGATVRPDGTVALNFLPSNPSAYPISTTTWAIVFQHQSSAEKAALLRSFFTYAVKAGQAWTEELGYAPLPSGLVANDLSEISTIQP
jgi:phosphate transport system substrate-binding protein